MHDKRRIGLTRMYPGRDHDSPPHSYVLRPTGEVSDNDHLTVVLSECLAQHSLTDAVLGLRGAQALQQLGTITVGVGVAMSEIDVVVVMKELELESKGVVEATAFLFHAVLVVADMLAIAVPANSLLLGCLSARVDQWLLSLVVRRIRLDQVYDVELVDLVLPRVPNLEEVPLGVGGSTLIVLQDEVVLVLTHLACPPEIGRLKARLKNQRVVLLTIFDVVRPQLRIKLVQLVVPVAHPLHVAVRGNR